MSKMPDWIDQAGMQFAQTHESPITQRIREMLATRTNMRVPIHGTVTNYPTKALVSALCYRREYRLVLQEAF
jgi:hypothetical protein